jgi:Transposase DDE domain
MFTRIKTVSANGRRYDYLHIVENYREDGRVRQRIVASLGRLDELLAKGDLQRVVEGMLRCLPQLRLVEAQRQQSLVAESDRVWGPVLVFERLWQELGLDAFFKAIAARRRLGFDLERAVFALVLQRLLSPGSDLQGSKWIRTVEAEGFDKLQLPHFYKTLGVLWRSKEQVEQHLYRRGLDLFNQGVDLVFFDTTSTYFEGVSWEGWAKRGMSRDHRPDHLQLILGVVMRRDGVPISCEIWPGNTADVKTLTAILDAMKQRFRIRKVVLVCDRGMVSAANLKAVAAAGYQYIVGMRMRRNLEVREQVLRRAGRYRELKHNLHVKEVFVDERRYVVCCNPERAEKDRKDRAAILDKLTQKLSRGSVKGLIGNVGYRRFLKAYGAGVEIDQKRVQDDERYDGKYVLRTNTTLPAAEVAEAYRQLTWIERLWRELKDVMEVRPIYHHQKKDNVKGHIFAAFLALYLSAMLRRRLDELWRREHPDEARKLPGDEPARSHTPWEPLLRDLSQLRALRVRLDDELYLLRTDLKGTADRAFRAVGVRPPALAEKIPAQ